MSKEALYLAKMRQAYDEFVLHARMDMADFEKEIEAKKMRDIEEHTKDLQEQDRQKKALVAYIEYVKARNMEIIGALNESQADERHDAKAKLKMANEATEQAAQQGRSEIAQLQIELQKSKMEAGNNEDDAIRLGADLGWANERIKKLESGLHDATTNLNLIQEQSNKWEFKCGEQAQQLKDLERVRKALTHQLHNLRAQMGPEQEKLSQMTEKMQEVDREYELSLHAISEKDATIIQRGSHMQLLQRQVREMRYSMSQKDKALARAAKILAEYSVALKEAEFDAIKRTIEQSNVAAPTRTVGTLQPQAAGDGEGGDDERSTQSHNYQTRAKATASPIRPSLSDFVVGKGTTTRKGRRTDSKSEVVEVMKRTKNMDSALKRLCELLLPFEEKVSNVVIEDEGAEAMVERERHVSQLHRNVNKLKESLDRTEGVAITKVKKSLSENQVLVEEVNNLRYRLTAMTKENQMHKANIDMMRIRLDQNNGSIGDGSESRRRDRDRINDRDVGLEDSLSDQHSQDNSPKSRSHSYTKVSGAGRHATQSTSITLPGVSSVLATDPAMQQPRTQPQLELHSQQGQGHGFARPNEHTQSLESFDSDRHRSDISLSQYLQQEQIGIGVDEGKIGEAVPSSETGKVGGYVSTYGSGDGSPIISEEGRREAEVEMKRQAEIKANILREVNETSKRVKEAVQRNKGELGSNTEGNMAQSGLALEDSISSLKTADEKIAAIMAENDAKIKSMRSESSAEQILSYYQTQLNKVDVPAVPKSGDIKAYEGSTAKNGNTTSSTKITSNLNSTTNSRQNSAATRRPVSKGPALKQSALNSNVQLPEIRK